MATLRGQERASVEQVVYLDYLALFRRVVRDRQPRRSFAIREMPANRRLVFRISKHLNVLFDKQVVRFADSGFQRQFSDAQYQAIIDRDGVIGMAFDIIMLQPGYVRGVSAREATVARVVDNIDIICQMAGNARNVGLGTDLDGGYGNEQTPADLDRFSDAQRILPELLRKRGYPEVDVVAIMSENWLRFFGEVLP